MVLDHINLTSFRNIASASVDFVPGTNVLIGENAQGKTNLAEAVYLLACGKSFRSSRYRDMIAGNEEKSEIVACISGEGLPFELKMVLSRKEGKEIFKNGVKIHKLSEFLGLFRVVLFCPEHLSLIKDGPAKRRSFLDGAICQIRPYYASLLNECNQIEAQRSALLKRYREQRPDPALLSVWDERLCQVSVKIAGIRASYLEKLKDYAPIHFSKISGGEEKLTLSYESDVFSPGRSPEEMEKNYGKLLKESLSSDLKYGFTQKGIHRDDFYLEIDSLPARGFASQGQQRSAVLSLKLAEGEISREMTGQEPVYLLDDVLSELDEKRRTYITSGLSGKQVLFTGTEENQFRFVENKVKVKGGVFSS